ncbi:hypothetical protein GBA63_05810 [Rubrobacter tropicus]|uniref:Uncharacterized protein n=1 Tax=Rubrobacter tropicus TaxID=2653851 RepID=A0A6G8Q6V7_9ACTN|nr:hypothetical protein [Rubrobacter tropicus]QIN82215.1 hypothetical protein GBA63_05810 [Rubrobacter tropicus]
MIETAPTQRTGRLPAWKTSRLLSVRPFGRRRHKMTRAGLRNLARARSEALIGLLQEREASRPLDDVVIKDHEYPHRRVTLHDIETQRIYAEDYLEGISELREQLAERGIRSWPLNAYYASPQNEADLRTISTALLEMAGRLRT